VKVTVACLYIGCLYAKELCIEFQDSSTALFASREHLLEYSFNCQQSGKQFLTSPLASFPGSPPKWKLCFINPRRACTVRVTVVVLCVCVSVCVSVFSILPSCAFRHPTRVISSYSTGNAVKLKSCFL